MQADWREALRGLDLPAGEDSNSPETQETPEARKLPRIVVSYERKGRGGKQATILSGFDCSDSELEEIASTLKKRLACGGSARGGEILLQGDRRESVRTVLQGLGYKTN